MKKIFSKTALFVATLAIVAASVMITSCGDDDPTVKVTGIKLSQNKAILMEEQQLQLTATVLPENATDKKVTFASEDPSIATVSQTGLVTAVSQGVTQILATSHDGGYNAYCEVEVKAWVVVPDGITLNPKMAEIEKGETLQLTTIVTPEEAPDKRVLFTSSNTDVATVSESGLVTGKSAGTAIITAKTYIGGLEATSKVTVKANVPAESVTFNDVPDEIYVGDEVVLIATVHPDNATDKSVNWSWMPEYISLNIDPDNHNKATVKAIKKGNAFVSAKTTGTPPIEAAHVFIIKDFTHVTNLFLDQSSATMPQYATLQLTATVSPYNATNPSVTWSSSNSSVASVTQSGLVKAEKPGNATITVTANDGGLSRQCSITVKNPTLATNVTLSGPSTISRSSYNNGTKYYVHWNITPTAANINPFHFEFSTSNNFGIDKTTGQIYVNYMGTHRYRLVMDDGSGVTSNWVTTNVVD